MKQAKKSPPLHDDSPQSVFTVHDPEMALYYIKSIGGILSGFDINNLSEGVKGIGYFLEDLAGEMEKCLARKGREG